LRQINTEKIKNRAMWQMEILFRDVMCKKHYDELKTVWDQMCLSE